MEPKLSRCEKLNLILHLNRIDDPCARKAYIDHRRGSLFALLALFLVSKVIHLAHVLSIQLGDLDEYRRANPDVIAFYPIRMTDDMSTDTGSDALASDCRSVIVQYVFVMIFIVGAMLLIKKTDCYITWLAWIIAVIQICELPFYPVFPSWYLILTAAWVFSSYFFLTVLAFQTLFQAFPILLVLLLGLPLRLYLLLDVDHIPYGYLSVFGVLAFFVAVLISIDVVSLSKIAFKQLYEMHR